MKKSSKVILTLCLVVIWVIASVLCYAELGSFNFIRAGIGLIQVMTGTEEIVQVASFPEKCYLVVPEGGYDLFVIHLSQQGYELLADEQAGSQFPVEKDGIREFVFWSSNRYFQKWQWG